MKYDQLLHGLLVDLWVPMALILFWCSMTLLKLHSDLFYQLLDELPWKLRCRPMWLPLFILYKNTSPLMGWDKIWDHVSEWMNELTMVAALDDANSRGITVCIFCEHHDSYVTIAMALCTYQPQHYNAIFCWETGSGNHVDVSWSCTTHQNILQTKYTYSKTRICPTRPQIHLRDSLTWQRAQGFYSFSKELRSQSNWVFMGWDRNLDRA